MQNMFRYVELFMRGSRVLGMSDGQTDTQTEPLYSAANDPR